MRLGSKVALVTGGGGGFGRAIAQALADEGAQLLIADVRDSGSKVADELDGVFLQADLSSMEETKELARRAVKEAGRVDVLVNNAGVQHIDPVEEFPEDEWARMLQIMLVAPFQLTKYLIPGMKEGGWGRIINISSIHGLVASPYKSAYTSAKHGIVGLTKTVALEVGEHGITVNAICPGYADTPLVQSQIAEQARTRGIPEVDVVEKVMLEPAAVKRLIDPEEVAALATFLATDDARSITGSAITIDAGWTAR